MKPVELQAAPSHDIVAAALSQSLGTAIVSANEIPPLIPVSVLELIVSLT